MLLVQAADVPAFVQFPDEAVVIEVFRLEAALAANPKEVAPYKILPGAIEGVKSVVLAKLRVFNRIS